MMKQKILMIKKIIKENNFVYMSANGNSFFVYYIDLDLRKNFKKNVSYFMKKKITQLFTNGNYGLKADGFIFLYKENNSFFWDFFNNDGSIANLCGNALRCAIYFLSCKNKNKKTIQISTRAGKFSGTVSKDSKVKVNVPICEFFSQLNVLQNNHDFISINLVKVGVFHLVIKTSGSLDLEKSKEILRKMAVSLRSQKKIKKLSSNVTFYKKTKIKNKKNCIQAITYENGVNDFTLACGTGAIAAAVDFKNFKNSFDEVNVKMPGGFLKVKRNAFDKIFLSGDVCFGFAVTLPSLPEKFFYCLL